MKNVIFVAPYFLETTLRFVAAAAELPGVRLGLVSSDPADKLPPGLRAKLAAHHRTNDCLDVKDLTVAVRAIAKQLGSVDRLIGTLEELQVPLATVRETFDIDGMKTEAARNFRDKSRMKDVLRNAGLPCARHRLVVESSEAWEFAKEVGYPIVVKPPAGAGAKSTFRVDSDESLTRALAAGPPRADRPVLLEEFMTGAEHSFDSIFVKGKPVFHSISRYFPTPLEVLENPWIQWVVMLPRRIDGPEFHDIRDVAARSLRVLGLETGLTHMEWFRRGDGSVAVSEVAVRPPGAQFTSLLSWAHDYDFYRGWAQVVIFEEFAPPPRRYAVGAAYLRGQGQGRVKAIHGLDTARRELGDLVVEAKLPRADQAPAGTYEGEGYVILRHPDTNRVEEALKRLVTLVRVELG